MNVTIVFEISDVLEGTAVNSVWDDEDKAYWHCDALNREGIVTYYETYEVLTNDPRTAPHSFTE